MLFNNCFFLEASIKKTEVNSTLNISGNKRIENDEMKIPLIILLREWFPIYICSINNHALNIDLWQTYTIWFIYAEDATIFHNK